MTMLTKKDVELEKLAMLMFETATGVVYTEINLVVRQKLATACIALLAGIVEESATDGLASAVVFHDMYKRQEPKFYDE